MRQALAWSLAAISASSALSLSGFSWNWALAGGIAAAAVFIAELHLAGRCGGALARQLGASGVGRALLLAYGVWTVLACARAAALGEVIFPDQNAKAVTPAAVLLLSALCSLRGSMAPARSAGVIALCLGGIYALILLAAMGQVRLSWIEAGADARQGLASFCTLLAPCAITMLPLEKKRPRAAAAGAALALLPALFCAASAGSLSPQVAAAETPALYAAAKSLSVFSVMERFEAILSAAMFLGLFCMTSLLAQSGGAALCAGKRKWPAAAVCAAAYASMNTCKRLPDWFWQGGAAVCWGILPISALLIVAIKKSEKRG